MMVRYFSFVVFICALVIQGCSSSDKVKTDRNLGSSSGSSSSSSSSSSSGDAFSEPLQQAFKLEIEAALDSGDPETLEALFYTVGVDPELSELSFELSSSELFNNVVSEISFLDADDSYEGFDADYHYTPNLGVVGEVLFDFEESSDFFSSVQIAYGLTDGQYRFVQSKRELMDYDGPRNTQIGFSTLSNVTDGEPHFNVRVSYTVSGLERVIEDVIPSGYSRTFWGQHIDSLSLERISGDAEFWFSVSADGEVVYESGEGSGSDVLTYERE